MTAGTQMEGPYIEVARERVKQGHFFLSHHAQIERGNEQITVDDIVSAVLSGSELEPYPDDPRGESCLIVGQTLDSRWIHVLCGNFNTDHLLIITVYVPSLPKWKDPFTRRI
jgi:hypothetical protein